MPNEKHKLRSADWFGRTDKSGFIHRSWMKIEGVPDHEFDGRPVIGICNTWSELTPCNSHFRELADMVKHGVYEAGGFPLEFPVTSLGEPMMRPTTMLFRNLASMDVEETIRANPLDGGASVSRGLSSRLPPDFDAGHVSSKVCAARLDGSAAAP